MLPDNACSTPIRVGQELYGRKVGRAIIDDDDFQVWVALVKNRPNSFLNRCSRVVAGYDDRDLFRRVHCDGFPLNILLAARWSAAHSPSVVRECSNFCQSVGSSTERPGAASIFVETWSMIFGADSSDVPRISSSFSDCGSSLVSCTVGSVEVVVFAAISSGDDGRDWWVSSACFGGSEGACFTL